MLNKVEEPIMSCRIYIKWMPLLVDTQYVARKKSMYVQPTIHGRVKDALYGNHF